jgi:hypothetical protein
VVAVREIIAATNPKCFLDRSNMSKENKMKNKIISIATMLVFFISTAFSQYQISNSVIGAGGKKTANTLYTFNSTVGESFTGKFVNTINQHQTGFWYVYQQQTITAVEDELTTIPTVFKLEQNYPNPFNPSTIIKFAIPERSNVLIKIYDITGSEIATLVDEEMNAGWYKKDFNANSLASGVYLYRMQAGAYVSIKKMLLMK